MRSLYGRGRRKRSGQHVDRRVAATLTGGAGGGWVGPDNRLEGNQDDGNPDGFAPTLSRRRTPPGRAPSCSSSLAVTSALGVVLIALWPEPAGDGFYSTARSRRSGTGGSPGTLLAAGLVIDIPAQAVAAMLVARHRGATWATAGGLIMVVGAALQATAIAGWTALYYYATGPGLDGVRGHRLPGPGGLGSRLFAVALPGARWYDRHGRRRPSGCGGRGPSRAGCRSFRC